MRTRRGKAEADSERFSGDGSAPRRAFRRANVFPAIVILHSESKRFSGRYVRESVCAWSAPEREARGRRCGAAASPVGDRRLLITKRTHCSHLHF